MNNFVARAIDVGYGNTKFTTADSDAGFNCQIFPSIATRPGSTIGVGGTDYDFSQYVDVKVDDYGTQLRVGKEAAANASATTQRALGAEFCLSPEYLAFVRGALYYMRVPQIDVLVLGLPVTTFKSHKDRLRLKMAGTHVIPSPYRNKNNPGLPPEARVQVANVMVVAQPVGAFFNYCVPRGLYDDMSETTNLVIDVGYGTLDWCVAKGSKSYSHRCGGYDGGVSSVVNSVADAIGAGQTNIEALARIDIGLRERRPIMLKGKKIDLFEEYGTVAEGAIRAALNVMINKIGNPDDIDHIILTGGGAKLYRDELFKLLPSRVAHIKVEDDPVTSNVCGFQYVAEQVAENFMARK